MTRLKQSQLVGETRVRQLNNIENRYAPAMTRQYKAAFDVIKDDIKKRLLTQKVYDSRAKIAVADIYRVLIAAQIIGSFTGSSYTQLLRAGFNYTNSGLRLIGRALPASFIQQLAIKRLATRRNRINSRRMARNIRKDLIRVFASSGGDANLIRQRIDQMYSFKTRRARIAAQSEVNYMANNVEQAGWRQVGVEYKEWHTAEDDRVCPYCRPFHGRVILINANFVDKNTILQGNNNRTITTIEDIKHPPLHPNCRCVLLPVL